MLEVEQRVAAKVEASSALQAYSLAEVKQQPPLAVVLGLSYRPTPLVPKLLVREASIFQ